MIGLILAMTLFTVLALITNKRLNANQTLHIWIFTVTFQLFFDLYIDLKLGAYWYFTKDVEWISIIQYIFLVPPVNIIFLNYYPFKKNSLSKVVFITLWVIAILSYEVIALLPSPWGYFRYGWWKLWYSALLNPILLIVLVKYYKWICHLEEKLIRQNRIYSEKKN